MSKIAQISQHGCFQRKGQTSRPFFKVPSGPKVLSKPLPMPPLPMNDCLWPYWKPKQMQHVTFRIIF